MRVLTSAIMLSLLAAQVPAAAANRAPLSLPATSKWEINYDEDACHLFRLFGSGEQSALLALTREGPSDWLQMTVVSDQLKYNGIAVPVEVAVGNQAQPYKLNGVALTSTDKDGSKHPVIKVDGLRLDGWQWPQGKTPLVNPAAISPQTEAAVSALTIKVPGKQPIRLETGSLGEPMKAMRTCTDDLLQHWGYDPKAQAALSKRTAPSGDMGRWLRSEDYPNAALTDGHNGMVRFRLDVGADGAVTGCRVLYRTNPDDFADLSCKLLLQRARMTPALDAAGKPVKDYFVSQIRWVAGSW